MNIRIVPDITTIEQASDAIVADAGQPLTATRCASLADLYATRARLWNELALRSPLVHDDFLRAAVACSLADTDKAKAWAARGADGRK